MCFCVLFAKMMKSKEDNSKMLASDKVQPIDDILSELQSRSSAGVVPFEIDQNKTYTIEDVYLNELEYRKQQVIADLKRENVFIDTQIDGKVEIYYKGNDTYTNLLRSQLNEIESLLPDLNSHSLYVQIKYKPDGVELTGEKQVEVKRDGVLQKEKQFKCPVFISKNTLESTLGDGYKLSVEKIKANEVKFHDPIVIAKREKARQEQEKLIAELQKDENEEQPEVLQNKKAPEAPKPQNKSQPQVTLTQPQQTANQKSINTVLNTLGAKENNVQPTTPPKQNQPSSEAEPDDALDALIDEMLLQGKMDIKTQRTQQQAQAQNEMLQQVHNLLDDNSEFDKETKESEPEQNNEVVEAKKQLEQLLMTEHEMKLYNFKCAANEVKNRILQAYNGNEAMAIQDADYQHLISFVNEKYAQEQKNEKPGQQKIDWNLPENKVIMDQDLQNKRKGFEKRYNNELFDEIEERANKTRW